MKKVSIDIIAGFLGAGKTTLINKLLDEAYIGEKVAVLENEFGAVSIDGDFIDTAGKSGVQVTEITNGCICCTLRSSLTAGLLEICRDFAPNRIIIEPTGLADLEDIATPIEDAAKECPLVIDHVITVVSAEHYEALKVTIGPFLTKQISNAGLVVLSRAEAAAAAIGEELRQNFPGLPVIDEPWSKISGLTILDLVKPYCRDDRNDQDKQEEQEHHHGAAAHNHDHDHCHHDHDHCHHDHDHCHHDRDHGHHGHHHTAPEYSYYCAKTDRVFEEGDILALAGLFQGEDGGEVYRAKGILKGAAHGFRFDFVGGSFSLQPFEVNGEGKFTVIGKSIDTSFWEKTIGTKAL